MADNASAHLRLVTQRDEDAEAVRQRIQLFLAEATEKDCVGVAMVAVRGDGSSFVMTYGRGSRVLMMGAVADLQYTLAKDGDAA